MGMNLNPEALEPLYAAAIRASQVISVDGGNPHLWNQLMDAIALAEKDDTKPDVPTLDHERPAMFGDAGLNTGFAQSVEEQPK